MFCMVGMVSWAVLTLAVAIFLLLDALLTLVASDVVDLTSSMSSLSSLEDSSAVSVVRAFLLKGTVLLGLLPGLFPLFGQFLAMCPCFLHRKHLPSLWSCFLSSLESFLKVLLAST